ncbi:MAG: YdcF family protein [Candidatus Nomurabacteria bacterium]|jgi:uncharacterized SAM-binding protein YcdF (DUF218 family)|nr:YdcF family protein [Candidatus Nomurabacteria bacterium]
MFKWILSIVVCVIALIFGLSIWLSPDNLKSCGADPSAQIGCGQADAIVAISGGDTEARAKKAIQLYRNGWASKIIFSGAAADPTSPSNAGVMKNLALQAGVPAAAIKLDETSKNTVQNAQNVAKILWQNHLAKIILVSSPYHLRRAEIVFNKTLKKSIGQNFQLRTAAATDSDWGNSWWLTPRGWLVALGETGGIIKYEISGR